MILGEPELRPHWTMVDGLRVFARVSASPHKGTEPIVLVHGLGVSSSYMTPLAKLLTTTHTVWAPDLPGYGRSDHPGRALNIPELAQSLGRWMDACGVGPAILAGNSMGCQIVAELAAVDPWRAKMVVLLSPTFDPAYRGIVRNVFHLYLDAWREPAGLVGLQAHDYWRNGPFRTIRTFYHARDHDMAARLREIAVPGLVMHGERDPIVSEKWARTVTKLLREGTLVTVPGAAHALNYDVPEAVAESMRSLVFLHAGG